MPSSETTTAISAKANSEAEAHAALGRGLHVLIDHAKADIKSKKNPPQLSHYRVLPDNIQTAYNLLTTGAQLIRATATKYALVGAISTKDHITLGEDLLKGCELVGAATHVTTQDSSGCSRAVREANQKASLAIYVATLRLVEAFHPELAKTGSAVMIATSDNTVGAQKTGAVWEACDFILNKKLPQGNRTAIRREIFTWTRECNDTMEEFEEMIQLGPKQDEAENVDDEDDDDPFDDFGEEQYTEDDMPLAKPCLALLKNSRGNMKNALETCEALGAQITGNEKEDERTLEAILNVHEYAKKVGEGVTDLGSILYPPILPSTAELEKGVRKQTSFIIAFQEYTLGLPNLPSNVTELANTLKNAAEKREKDFFDALKAYRNRGTLE